MSIPGNGLQQTFLLLLALSWRVLTAAQLQCCGRTRGRVQIRNNSQRPNSCGKAIRQNGFDCVHRQINATTRSADSDSSTIFVQWSTPSTPRRSTAAFAEIVHFKLRGRLVARWKCGVRLQHKLVCGRTADKQHQFALGSLRHLPSFLSYGQRI